MLTLVLFAQLALPAWHPVSNAGQTVHVAQGTRYITGDVGREFHRQVGQETCATAGGCTLHGVVNIVLTSKVPDVTVDGASVAVPVEPHRPGGHAPKSNQTVVPHGANGGTHFAPPGTHVRCHDGQVPTNDSSTGCKDKGGK